MKIKFDRKKERGWIVKQNQFKNLFQIKIALKRMMIKFKRWKKSEEGWNRKGILIL
jgi:hypothetical protein